eukprot:1655753-Amphidinium_carterae.2
MESQKAVRCIMMLSLMTFCISVYLTQVVTDHKNPMICEYPWKRLKEAVSERLQCLPGSPAQVDKALLHCTMILSGKVSLRDGSCARVNNTKLDFGACTAGKAMASVSDTSKMNRAGGNTSIGGIRGKHSQLLRGVEELGAVFWLSRCRHAVNVRDDI